MSTLSNVAGSGFGVSSLALSAQGVSPGSANVRSRGGAAEPAGREPVTDSVELSPDASALLEAADNAQGEQLIFVRASELNAAGADALAPARRASDFRADKVAAIKAQLNEGTYDADGKLDVVASRILKDLDVQA